MATRKRNSHFGTKVARATFKWDGIDSSGVSNSTIAAHGLGIYLPAGAVIINAMYDIPTTFTSATDAATISFGVGSATDLKAATAISTGTTYDNVTNLVAFTPVSAATAIKLSDKSELTATVAVEVLTAGEMEIYILYFVP